MAIARLLVAFLAAFALLFQGLAATTCMCKLHHLQVRSAPIANSTTFARDTKGVAAQPAMLQVSVQGLAAPKAGVKHGKLRCATCSVACCHFSAPAPSGSTMNERKLAIEGPAAGSRSFASWAEPVPTKPPRS